MQKSVRIVLTGAGVVAVAALAGLAIWRADGIEVSPRDVPQDVTPVDEGEAAALLEVDSLPLADGGRSALDLVPGEEPMALAVAHAYFDLGVTLYRRGDKEEAIKCWFQAVSLQPEDGAARYNLGLALTQLKRYDQAIPHLQQAVGAQPCRPEVLQCLAVCYVRTHQREEALRTLEEALPLARQSGAEELAAHLAKQIELYRRNGRTPQELRR